jgi:uncharacterized protein (TIGR03089 family)
MWYTCHVTTRAVLFATPVAADATQPLLTYYDDASGERVELSGVTLGNWVAKTANLLVDGVGTLPGEVALVRLPPHWQTAAVLLGCWSAGLIVTGVPLPSGVSVAFTRPAPEILGRDDALPGGDPEVGDVLVGASPTVAGERYVLGLHPLGAPLPAGQVPPGHLDFTAEVRGYGDRFAPAAPLPGSAPAAPGSTRAELAARALARAGELGIGSGDRVLIDASTHPDHLDWLLAPLAAGASIVLCGHLDHARLPARTAAERVTVSLA